MDARWRQTFLAWAETTDHRAAVAAAQGIITKALAETRPYLSFSGGKDSTVMLHLVMQYDTNIYVYHRYDRAGLHKYEREVINIAETIGAKNLHVFDYWQDTRPLEGDIAVELQSKGYNATFVGLRKEESARRRRRIKANNYLILGFKEWWPLADWRWLDIWAYVISNNLPYVSLYDERAPLLGWDKVRFSTFFDRDLDSIGTAAVDGLLNWRDKYGDARRQEKFSRE